MNNGPANENLGPLLRLWGLSMHQVPAATASAADLAPLLLALLQEAVSFIDTVDDRENGLWHSKGTETIKAAAAGNPGGPAIPVEVLGRVVSSRTLGAVKAQAMGQQNLLGSGGGAGGGVNVPKPGNKKKKKKEPHFSAETWVARRSRHRDAAKSGTASWAEFRTYLKDRHAATEKAMTPTVVGAHEALGWPVAATALHGVVEGGRCWSDFTLSLLEMRHNVGRPVLEDRVFPVLQMSCATVGNEGVPTSREFLVVSVTVDGFATAETTPPHLASASRVSLANRSTRGGHTAASGVSFASGASAASGASVASGSSARSRLSAVGQALGMGGGPKRSRRHKKRKYPKKFVAAAYVSVERVRVLPTESGDAIEWVMATASDARGKLPQIVQRVFVPGAIVKDVRLFLKWMVSERKRLAQGGTLAPGSGLGDSSDDSSDDDGGGGGGATGGGEDRPDTPPPDTITRTISSRGRAGTTIVQMVETAGPSHAK